MTPLTLATATATATDPSPWPGALILLGFALAALVGYALACWVFPFGHCRRCGGDGRRHSSTRKHFRLCRRCGGSGRRVRIGRRVWNYFAARRREAR